ncbi:MAG: hypothetical protein PHY26_01945 [Bacilli bacterium]|jgi:uncharacterized protein related to proFAR isomerase|nr:hypothetical protein [Bacilli bacterium]
MNNKKGQVLVLFIIFIPLILLLGTFVIDVGNNYSELNKLNNINKMIIDYGLRNIEKINIRGELIELLYQNDETIDEYKLDIKDNEIILTIKKHIDGILGSIINQKRYYIKSIYHGKLKNGEIKIEKGH